MKIAVTPPKVVTRLSLFAIMVGASSAFAATVWNVNIGGPVGSGATYEITPGENYQGAATENTANSVWNPVNSPGPTALLTSTGAASGASIAVTTPAGGIGFNSTAGTTGDEIFKTWAKDNGNNNPFTATFSGLSTDPGTTYSLVTYSGWFWGNGANGDEIGISQTAGTGLAGFFALNSIDMEGAHPLATGLAQDTDPANTDGNFNYARFDNLIADGSGNLAFTFSSATNPNGGVDAPINGFQLVEFSAIPEPSSALLSSLGLLVLLRRRR